MNTVLFFTGVAILFVSGLWLLANTIEWALDELGDTTTAVIVFVIGWILVFVGFPP